MTNCKQLPLPKLKVDNIDRVIHFFKLGNHLFNQRYNDAPHWKSFDLIADGRHSPMLKHFPEILDWIEQLKKHTAIKNIENMYLAVLAPKQQIPWHKDMSRPGFHKAFITALQTNSSFIEFEEDKHYTYRESFSYALQTGVHHRIINTSDEYRITLCTTPKENPYV